MTGSRLDPWIDSYAQRANGMTASEIRALFAVASRPEVVSLAGGMPYVEALPMEAIAGTVAHLLATRGTAPCSTATAKAISRCVSRSPR